MDQDKKNGQMWAAKEVFNEIKLAPTNLKIYRDHFVIGVGDNGLMTNDPFFEPNILITGNMGFGKSQALRTILSSWMKFNGDRTVAIICNPFKNSNEHRDAFCDLKQVSVHDEDMSAQSFKHIISLLKNELTARTNLFRGLNCDYIREYEDETGVSLSRILLVIEDFNRMSEEMLNFSMCSDTIGSPAFDLKELMKKGRSFGISLVATSQKSASVDISPNLLSNFGVKLVGRTSSTEAMYLLGNLDPSKLESRDRGTFFTDSGSVQIPFLSETEIKSIANDSNPLTATTLTFDPFNMFPEVEPGTMSLEIKRSIAAAIIAFKVRKKIKAKDLAVKIGTDPTSVSFMASGDVSRFTLDYLIKCAEKLNDDEINKGLKRIVISF